MTSYWQPMECGVLPAIHALLKYAVEVSCCQIEFRASVRDCVTKCEYSEYRYTFCITRAQYHILMCLLLCF